LIVSASCTLAGAVAVALPASAQALVSVSACDGATLTQPFAPWADFNYYKLAPGGDFESGLAGWSLQGGAAAAGGSESFGVTGSVGSSSLALPAGAVALSPQTCVNAAYPDFRFFLRSDTPGTMVSVSVVYQTPTGTSVIPVGTVAATSAWQPTLPMATGSAIAGAFNGGTAYVSLQFTASGGTAQIDDVFVDPWGGH
jgi:hypothetical protein